MMARNMKPHIVHSAAELGPGKGAAVTIGNFDGVHKGHQALIRRTLEVADQAGLESVLVTFDPHPRLVVAPERGHVPLTTRRERMALLGAMGVRHVLELPFTPELAMLEPAEFVRLHLAPLPMRELVVGHDFTLGRGRSGSAEVLRSLGTELGFGVERLDPVICADGIISSTRLRQCVAAGDVWLARRLLGRRYGYDGRVVKGEGRGRVLGFPTANFAPAGTLLPAEGVYATALRVDGSWHAAVTNIGNNPTFDGKKLTVESFLLDYEGDLYGKELRLEFAARLRGEKRFAGPEDLTAQIRLDVATARQVLARQGVEPGLPEVPGFQEDRECQ